MDRPSPPPTWLRLLSRLASLLRPRLSWRYILSLSLLTPLLSRLARRQPLLSSRLPPYTGPHAVGTLDLEVPLDPPRRISPTTFKDSGDPAFELRTTLFTAYYPAPWGAVETAPRHAWIARPIALKARGFARFIHLDNPLVRALFTLALWALGGSQRIPAEVDAPLLRSRKRFPVIIFSHGDASSRNDYTGFAGELASRGCVVLLLEHRDGSSAGTVLKIRGQPDRHIPHFHPAHLLPRMDRSRYKEEQLAMRDAEILQAASIVKAVNDGHGRRFFSLNPRREGRHLHSWAHRLDLSRLLLAGHSLGATSALQALKNAPAFVGGLIFDPGKASGPLNQDISVPILVVHSHSWSSVPTHFHGRPHFDAVRDLVRGVLRRSRAAWFLTSLGTSHPTVTDWPLVEPWIIRWTTGASLDVNAALREYVRVALEFIDLLPCSSARDPSGTRDSLIDAPPTDHHDREGSEPRHDPSINDHDDEASHDDHDQGSEYHDDPSILSSNQTQRSLLLLEKITHPEYGKWASEQRQVEFEINPDAKLWQLHVCPASHGA